MKVELIDYTQDALEKLLFTKQTRLSMNGGLLDEIKKWPEEKKKKELAYIRGTIQSSFEFVNYTFSIQGVSRAFTHQLVRTRHGSYAQQSMRTVNMSGFDYVTPDSISDETINDDGCLISQGAVYSGAMERINNDYQEMIRLGANPQDARGILPTNIATNIVAAFNLRTLSDMAKLRLCTRTQGEYSNVFREMRKKIIEIHPWAADFILVHCAATGVCCFPNYKECPIKPPIFNPDTGERWDLNVTKTPATRAQIQAVWENTKFEAVPKQMEEMKGEANV